MTDEEIEKRAKEIQSELVRYVDQDPDDIIFVADVLRSLVSQAYEEAARLACKYCHNGFAPERLRGIWYHPANPAFLNGWEMPCEADDIRALKDSLVAASVEHPSGR